MNLTAKLRTALIEVYKGKCQYCEATGANHIEHIVPRARGGKDELENYTLACHRCNSKKSSHRLPRMYEGILLAAAKAKVGKVIDRMSVKPPSGEFVRLSSRDGGLKIWTWISGRPTEDEEKRLWKAINDISIASFGMDLKEWADNGCPEKSTA